jgi:hypothetical protein
LKKTVNIFFAFAFIFAFMSCKINYSLDGASIPIEAKTVSVGFFTNNTTLGSPALSQKFTERLRDVVSTQTRLSLMKQNADLRFEGTIMDYNISPVAIQSNDLAAKNRLTVTVNVKYTNKFDETKNFDQNFSRFADYPTTSSLSSQEDALLTEINRQLTEDIFNKAFNNW